MTLKHLFLSSALSGSMAFFPLAIQAQEYDTWALNREVLNSAANYTGALTTSHTHVRNYITWAWNTAIEEDEQRIRTADILDGIRTGEKVGSALVDDLDNDVISSYDIRFRHCDSKLLSYFGPSGFKHGLSARQVVDAPTLRAERNGTTFYGEPLGIVRKSDDDQLVLERFGGRRQTPIPACMGGDYGGPLAEGTVAFMTSAAQKFGVDRTRKRRETERLRCENGQVGRGIKRHRFSSIDYNAQGDPLYNTQSAIPHNPDDEDLEYPYYDTATPEGDGHWKEKSRHCRAPTTISIYEVRDCPAGSSDTADARATYRVFLTEAYEGPDGVDIVWLPSDADGNLINAPSGALVSHLSFCDDTAPDRLTLEPEISTRRESRDGQCPATHPLGTITEARDIEIRSWSFADSPIAQGFDALREVSTEIAGAWAVDDDRCYRNANDTSTETRTLACPSGQTGKVTHQRTRTETRADWHWDGWQDQLTTSHTRWETASNDCKRRASGGGGGRGGGGPRSVDVDGDGRGDFSSSYDAERHGHGRGTEVDGPCGSCNGPKGGPSRGYRGGYGGGDGGGGRGGCFLTTAIVEQRGEADDGPTLTTLRAFRDGYMAQRPDGPALVAEYYDVAPRIVAAIPADDPAWRWIGTQVDLAVARIEAGDQSSAFAIYTAMVQRLKADWLTPAAAPAPRIHPQSNEKERLE